MRSRYVLIACLFAVVSVCAQTHITISDPDTWTTQELSAYVGQTVVFDQPIVICSNSSYKSDRYTVAPRRLFTPTNQAYPRTSYYNTVVSLNAGGAMELNGISNYHRCGEKIYNLKAKVNTRNSLSFISGDFRGNTRAELEAGIPDVGDYRLLVCTMNLEYYLAAGLGSGTMGPTTAEEHQRQRTKVNKALTRINADLYGFVEVESGDVAVQELATDLNNKLPGRNFTIVVDGTVPSGTFTKAGFVYDANKLEPIGTPISASSGTIRRERHQMICFREKATGETFIFSVNHFKAKSGAGTGGDANQNDGQGSFNATRVGEANEVIRMYNNYRQQHAIKREKDILIMGDLNAYGKEDPITTFTGNGMIDLHRAFHADSSYSYQFGGLAGYLDHAISNATLFPQVTGMAGFHCNSDESDDFTYDSSNDLSMFRCSDHDAVLVGLKLDSTLTYDPSPSINSATVLSGDARILTISNAVWPDQQSFYAIYDIQGVLLEQKEITDTFQEVELPASPGIYIVYIYAKGEVYQRKLIVR